MNIATTEARPTPKAARLVEELELAIEAARAAQDALMLAKGVRGRSNQKRIIEANREASFAAKRIGRVLGDLDGMIL